MAYEKTIWEDNKTPINAANLNKMEQGIEDAAKTGGVSAGAVIGWTKEEIPEGYEEIMLPSEIPVGMITDLEEGKTVPEGYEVIEVNADAPDYSKRKKITLVLNEPYTVDEDAFFQVVGEIGKDASSDVRITVDNQLLFYFWAKNMSTVTAPATPLKKGSVVKLEALTNSTVNFFKIPYLKKKQIKKVAVTPLPEPATASIINSTNVTDKEKNTYSANIIDEVLVSKALLGSEIDKLPVVKAKQTAPSEDLNEIRESGVYFVWSEYANRPSGATSYGGVLLVFTPQRNENTVVVQIYFDGAGGTVASRIRWYDSVGWQAWKTLT